jgi:hypothetical protein
MDPDKAAALLDLETAAAIEDPGEDADDQSAPAGG